MLTECKIIVKEVEKYIFINYRSECSSSRPTSPTRPSSSRPTSPTSFKESVYGSLPRSVKEQQLLVKAKVEDPEKVRERQEIVRTKSPSQLSQITSLSDFPVPTPVENMLKRKR